MANMGADQQAWVETWARHLDAIGLSLVALPLIEVAQALGFVGSQALLAVQPLMTGIVDDRGIARAVALLENPELLEQLRTSLEGKGG